MKKHIVTLGLAAMLGNARRRSCADLSEPEHQIRRAVLGRQRHRHAGAAARSARLATLGQNVIVENMAGGSGVIAAQNVVRSAPDGYTVFITSNTTHASNQSLLKKVPYDAVTDFEPVTKLGTITLALVAHPSVAGEGCERADRLCQGQSRQADIRQRLDVVARCRRIAQNRRRHRHAACSLQEQSAGGDRFARRADFAVLRRRLDLAAAGRRPAS